MSRPLLEWTVRRRLAAMPNVEVRGSTVVTGLEITTSRRCHRSGTPGRHSSAFCDGRADCAERYARATVDEVAVSCERDGNQTV